MDRWLDIQPTGLPPCSSCFVNDFHLEEVRIDATTMVPTDLYWSISFLAQWIWTLKPWNHETMWLFHLVKNIQSSNVLGILCRWVCYSRKDAGVHRACRCIYARTSNIMYCFDLEPMSLTWTLGALTMFGAWNPLVLRAGRREKVQAL